MNDLSAIEHNHKLTLTVAGNYNEPQYDDKLASNSLLWV